MSRLTRRFFCLAVLAVSISLLAACQKTTPSTPDLPDLKVGVVGVEQPKGTTDLLAGFIPEDRVLASDQAVATFNEAFEDHDAPLVRVHPQGRGR